MNSKSILLAYATRFGSTQEVAEAITATLREAEIEVELQAMQPSETRGASWIRNWGSMPG